MTTRTTAVDHPSRRLVVALPHTYDEARERYESLVTEVDFGRLSEMASWQDTLELAEINALHGFMSYYRSDITAAVDPDGDTKLAVDQPSLLFDSYDKPEIAAVGRELDGLLAGLITSLGGDVTTFLDANRETV
jgi:hypothetical protein